MCVFFWLCVSIVFKFVQVLFVLGVRVHVVFISTRAGFAIVFEVVPSKLGLISSVV